MPVASLRATKQLIVDGRIDAVRAARAREDAVFTRMIGQPANMEAISAFLEKRDPDFTNL
jgi:enoyl-CoA hydratase/carnithine racemase